MNNKNYLFIGVPIVAIGIYFIFSIFTSSDNVNAPDSFSEFDFTYVDANSKLKESLASMGISLSSPVKLSKIEDIEKYCSFFSNEKMADIVEYCTSTELRTSEKKFLGNIHMVGSKNLPKIVLVVIQDDPFLQNLNYTKSVYETVIDNLVCNCWEDIGSEDIESVGDWIDAQKNFHLGDKNPTSKSHANLMSFKLQLELTTNTEGYLWKLMISK